MYRIVVALKEMGDYRSALDKAQFIAEFYKDSKIELMIKELMTKIPKQEKRNMKKRKLQHISK